MIGDSDSLEGSPRSYPRQHSRPRHASSGNTMLDQLLSDISNKFVKYVDEVIIGNYSYSSMTS